MPLNFPLVQVTIFLRPAAIGYHSDITTAMPPFKYIDKFLPSFR